VLVSARTRLARLRELAQDGQRPWGWWTESAIWDALGDYGGSDGGESEFIAAMSPAVVLDLCQTISDQLDSAEQTFSETVPCCGAPNLCGVSCMDDEASHLSAKAYRAAVAVVEGWNTWLQTVTGADE
jgi:hypothetical protein